MRLARETFGEGTRTLVLLHGFTGDGSAFAHLVPTLGKSRRVVAVDLPGHGASPLPSTQGPEGFRATLDALAALVGDLAAGPVDLAGYSQGARVALAFALAHPDRCRRLVLESGTAGLETPEDREARRQSDEALAREIETGGVEAFARRWERLPLFESLRRLPAERAEALARRRRAQSAAGLAGALRTLGLGVQRDHWPALAGLDRPVLLLTGEEDGKFAALAGRMAAALPQAVHHVLPGCGHAPHLERPQEWLSEVEAFLDDTRSGDAKTSE